VCTAISRLVAREGQERNQVVQTFLGERMRPVRRVSIRAGLLLALAGTPATALAVQCGDTLGPGGTITFTGNVGPCDCADRQWQDNTP
jgi:hypothetical protein